MALKDLVVDEKSYNQGLKDGYQNGIDECKAIWRESDEELLKQITRGLIKRGVHKSLIPKIISTNQAIRNLAWVEKILKESNA